ncbi:MAG: hypothetical protein AAF772_17755 [Acidobacteriota bacterium]
MPTQVHTALTLDEVQAKLSGPMADELVVLKVSVMQIIVRNMRDTMHLIHDLSEELDRHGARLAQMESEFRQGCDDPDVSS